MSTEERKLAAIVFTDICGFTELMGRDEAKAMALLDQQRALLKPIISNFNGEWLKEIGDGVLISFPSAVKAVTCSLEIQRILAHNSDLTLRIGIHIGDVIKKGGDVFGDGVNIASRLEPLAEPGGICVSERVHEDIKNKPEISTAFQEEQLLKGVDKPIKVYSIFTQMGTPQEPLAETTISKKEKSKIPILAAGLAIGLLITVFALRTTEEPELTVERVFYTGERIPVAIADFENNTGDATLDGLSGLLITSLEQSNYLTVLTRSRMYDLLKQIGKAEVESVDEQIGREICHRANINALVLTSIRQFGELYSVDLKILDIEKDEYLFSTNVQAEGKKNIPGLIDEISKQTRISLAEKAEEIEKSQRDIASITTKNLEAYKFYNLGVKEISNDQWDDGIKHFEKAIEIDSTFALAYYQLAFSYQWNFNVPKTQFYIKKAVNYIESVPDKERLYIRAQSIIDRVSRLNIYKEIIQKYPNEKLAYYEYGDILYHSGESLKAIPYFMKSNVLDPTFEHTLSHLSWCYVDGKFFDKNIDLAQKTLNIDLNNPGYIKKELEAFLEVGRIDEYFTKVRALEASGVKFINFDFAYGDGYFRSGDYPKAIDLFKNSLKHEDYKIPSLRKLKSVAIIQGDLTRFLKYSDNILDLYLEQSNIKNYVSELSYRSSALLITFEDANSAKVIIDDIESIFKDKSKNFRFSDMGATTKFTFIDCQKKLQNWEKVDKLTEESIGQDDASVKQNRGLLYQQQGKYKEAIDSYRHVLEKVTNTWVQYSVNYNLGLCYMKDGDYTSAVKYFDQMKESYASGVGYRKYYHPLLYLQSGLANYELENYRLAKSNLEIFLNIWEPAPETLERKILARKTLEKIKDVS
jgi:adenylate cyclase